MTQVHAATGGGRIATGRGRRGGASEGAAACFVRMRTSEVTWIALAGLVSAGGTLGCDYQFRERPAVEAGDTRVVATSGRPFGVDDESVYALEEGPSDGFIVALGRTYGSRLVATGLAPSFGGGAPVLAQDLIVVPEKDRFRVVPKAGGAPRFIDAPERETFAATSDHVVWSDGKRLRYASLVAPGPTLDLAWPAAPTRPLAMSNVYVTFATHGSAIAALAESRHDLPETQSVYVWDSPSSAPRLVWHHDGEIAKYHERGGSSFAMGPSHVFVVFSSVLGTGPCTLHAFPRAVGAAKKLAELARFSEIATLGDDVVYENRPDGRVSNGEDLSSKWLEIRRHDPVSNRSSVIYASQSAALVPLFAAPKTLLFHHAVPEAHPEGSYPRSHSVLRLLDLAKSPAWGS